MNNVERLQQATKDFGDAATTSVHTFASSFQTIANAHADYAKKAMQDGSEFFAKLTSVKEPAKVMELQSEYAKNAYETFVAESKKLSELYADLFKQAAKPLQDLIAKSKAA
jgi:phasin family protein